jgi:DNA-binding NtrC family response regulator
MMPARAIALADPVRPGDAALAALLGVSPAMRRLREQIGRVAPTAATVLIVGESGSGKELVAEALHALSRRHNGPFIAVNCGAIAPTLIEAELLGHEKGSFTGADRQRAGYFERASGGTIFLDEVTEMPLTMQVKLLRVIEARQLQRVGGHETIPVDIRAIAATNRDIEREVADGRFREDLMYRLAVVPLHVPSLRERSEDIELLAMQFLHRLNANAGSSKSFSRGFLRRLALQTWPGNVRELKNAVERAFILGTGLIDTDSPTSSIAHFADAGAGYIQFSAGGRLDTAEQALVLATLEYCAGNRLAAARSLGISPKTLFSRLTKYRAANPDLQTPADTSKSR